MTSIPDDIQSELTNIGTSTAAIRNAIVAKGVAPTGGLSSYADAISSISGGGASSNCFPSGTYETLTLGASGATYTAPADGYFLIYISDPTGSAYGQGTTMGSLSFTISNNTKNGFGSSGELLITSGGGGSVAGYYKSYFPVSADDQISLTYTSGLNCTVHLLFYYTIDSAPQQSQT